MLPFLDINETTSVAYSLGHNLYTPKAVESPLQDPNDRPWASFLYGSMAMVTLEENHLDEYEITLGVVGPLALGEPIQKGWHKLIDTTTPRGWDNPPILSGIAMTRRYWPDVLQVAVFDTAFHQTIPERAATYAVPEAWRDAGLRRYGFHGTSHKYVMQRVAQELNDTPEQLRIISCHLGNGASICAIEGVFRSIHRWA